MLTLPPHVLLQRHLWHPSERLLEQCRHCRERHRSASPPPPPAAPLSRSAFMIHCPCRTLRCLLLLLHAAVALDVVLCVKAMVAVAIVMEVVDTGGGRCLCPAQGRAKKGANARGGGGRSNPLKNEKGGGGLGNGLRLEDYCCAIYKWPKTVGLTAAP